MQVYFDNAATTPLDNEVFEAMKPFMVEHFGNPSSIHAHGREVRAAIEQARKTVAALLNTSPSEIFFTSGGTEADNTAIICTIRTLGIKHAITSEIEHPAVLNSFNNLENNGEIKLSFVKLDNKGHIIIESLEELLKNNSGSFVSLMHGNNEIGNLNDIDTIGQLCEQYKAIFHSDTVQTMCHFKHDIQKLKTHFIVGSAHKFHGPKGVGFLYLNDKLKIKPFIDGGGQERNMRGGTENVYGIIGLAKAMEIAYRDMEVHKKHIQGLKSRMIKKVVDNIENVGFNGDCTSEDKSLYTVLNISLPESDINEMLLFSLDIEHISASGGSACSSGASVGSHVLKAIKADPGRGAVRFSFSKYNTEEEVDYVADKLVEMYKGAKRMAPPVGGA